MVYGTCSNDGNIANYDGLEEVIGDYGAAQVNYRARLLVGTHGFIESDLEDIISELSVCVWRDLKRFKPERSSREYFISLSISSRISELIRHKEAQCRDYRREECSLDEVSWLEEAEFFEKNKKNFRSAKIQEITDLAIDLDSVISSLPMRLKKICFLLAEQSLTEITRSLKISRLTLHRRLEKIREILRNRGLDRYLIQKNDEQLAAALRK